ncbi:MAG: Type 1 glutamine amidotransferase-like domain-containing protein [Bradymonadaceae bacterium]|nr:Type 1 glutamine amidotransferase-like domain-containing protein [Lujinxingiaceae bacterium]
MLLGPQSDYAEIAQVLDNLEVSGTVALITAGWQENEAEDDTLARRMGRPRVNLALHARSEKAFGADADLACAAAARQKHLQHLQEFYRMRLDAVDDVASAIAVRHVDPLELDEQRQISVTQLRHLDADHLARCASVLDDFDATWKPRERQAVTTHSEEIAAVIEGCDAVVIAGGHILALLNRMRLFDVLARVGRRPIVAWSAGAMALTERIVLFHDSPPFGKNLAQVIDPGLGICPGVVVLPDMSRRVQLNKREKIGRFAQRMAPATCIALDPGSRIEFKDGVLQQVKAERLTIAGDVEKEWKP